MKHNTKVGTVVKIVKSGTRFNALDKDGNKYTSVIRTGTRKRAYASGEALELRMGKTGKTYWWKVPMSKFKSATPNAEVPAKPTEIEIPDGHEEVVDFIKDSYSLKPKGLVMKELKWKYLIRSAVRGKNIMMTGQA